MLFMLIKFTLYNAKIGNVGFVIQEKSSRRNHNLKGRQKNC